jgi:hypothetical protein
MLHRSDDLFDFVIFPIDYHLQNVRIHHQQRETEMNNSRTKQILEIARLNALEGLDQNRVEDYEDNMRDTLADISCTDREAGMAEAEFNRIIAAAVLPFLH